MSHSMSGSKPQDCCSCASANAAACTVTQVITACSAAAQAVPGLYIQHTVLTRLMHSQGNLVSKDRQVPGCAQCCHKQSSVSAVLAGIALQ